MATERIQALIADDYTADLGERDLDDLRAMRDECHALETSISYYRRLAQGRIEILDAWTQRDGDDASVESLVADLPRILAGEAGRSPNANTRFAEAAPDIVELDFGGRERVVSDETLANLTVLSPDELAQSLADLRAFERELSELRRGLHSSIDEIEHEIATRQAADAVG